MTGTGYINSTSITIDSNSNIYVGGGFYNKLTAGTHSRTSDGDADAYVAKLSSTNGSISWLNSIHGTRNDVTWGLVTDSRYLYATGQFQQLVHLDKIILSGTNYNARLFVTRIVSATGAFSWAKAAGANNKSDLGHVWGTGIARYGSTLALSMKYYKGGSYLFDSLKKNIPSCTNNAGMSTITTNSHFQVITHATTQDAFGDKITFDRNGYAYLAASFSGTATFGQIKLTSRGKRDAAIIKMDSKGNVIWARSGGSINNDSAKDIVTDTKGNVYLLGTCTSTLQFGTHTAKCYGQSNSESGFFIVKLNSSGSYQWLRSGGCGSNVNMGAMAIDSQDNIYITGNLCCYGYFDSGSSNILNLTVGHNTGDIFIARLTSNGTFDWAEIGGNAKAHDYAKAITFDPHGNVYIHGMIGQYGSNNVAKFMGTTIKITSKYNAFVWKISKP